MGKTAVVIVAAGRGERLGGNGGPKQYRLLGARSVLQHTVNCFTKHPKIDAVQVVIHRDDNALYENSVKPDQKLLPPVTGGNTRQESCMAGIDALAIDQYYAVLIHDAARPFVSDTVISNVLAEIKEGTCTLPATAVADTLKRVDQTGMVVETLPRHLTYLAQTPQGFRLVDIKDAHHKASGETDHVFTDDAAVAEWAGLSVKIVDGDRNNFKITTAGDLMTAEEKILKQHSATDVRAGNGYDVHTLIPGESIILCGIEIPHNRSLHGHSDADVGLHSLTDALLGTIGAGDIGMHFPPSDPKWKGATSDQFLQHAVHLVRESNGEIMNLDVTLVCEAPKIGPHRDVMRNRIAEICAIDVSRISVKATTNERIGFIGREEGIAALASATVSFGSA
ncbi:MAG: bifunctional 2-C-methyl-D-erythritol 4-phosphate cytidylyltransferase/2-C-methyl-D-erythritol 2,4-cyclodiphosphate synthase [Rhizobiaceae bacterium]